VRQSDAEGTYTFSSWGFRIWCLVCAVVYGGTATGVLYGLGIHLHWPTPVRALAVTAAGAATVLAIVRSLRVGLTVSDAGLVVRNFMRTRRVDWSDVTGLRDGSHGRVYTDCWALKIDTSHRRSLMAKEVPNDGNLLDLLARLGAAHGVPVKVNRILPRAL
jgi:Bacterial PH domain